MDSAVEIKTKLVTMDEGFFHQLLEGPGTVEIDVAKVERYFIPVVSYLPDNQAPRVLYGAIVRSKTDLLGAETVVDLLTLLSDMTNRTVSLRIVFDGATSQQIGSI